MKKLAVVLFILIISTSFVNAQNQSRIYINSGFGFPMSPKGFSDYWKTGFNFGAALAVPINPNVDISFNFDYNTFPLDESKVEEEAGGAVEIDGGNASVWTLTSNIKANLVRRGTGQAIPYFLFGVGYYNINETEVTVSRSIFTAAFDSKGEGGFTLNGGFGVEFNASKNLLIFLDGRYQLIFTEDDNVGYLPVRAGIGFALN